MTICLQWKRVDQLLKRRAEKMGAQTPFSDYGLGQEVIEKIIASLKTHGMVKLGEKGTVTLEVVRQVLKLSL